MSQLWWHRVHHCVTISLAKTYSIMKTVIKRSGNLVSLALLGDSPPETVLEDNTLYYWKWSIVSEKIKTSSKKYPLGFMCTWECCLIYAAGPAEVEKTSKWLLFQRDCCFFQSMLFINEVVNPASGQAIRAVGSELTTKTWWEVNVWRPRLATTSPAGCFHYQQLQFLSFYHIPVHLQTLAILSKESG